MDNEWDYELTWRGVIITLHGKVESGKYYPSLTQVLFEGADVSGLIHPDDWKELDMELFNYVDDYVEMHKP